MSPGARVWRTTAVTVWSVALACYVWTNGVPIDRFSELSVLLSGLLLACVGRPLWRCVQLLIDWMPFLAALVFYDYVRGFADDLGTGVNVGAGINGDIFFVGWLTGGHIPTVWLQQHLYNPISTTWWELPVSLVYASRFVLAWLLATLFYLRDRATWQRFARRLLSLTFLGLVTFVVFPAAPPWWAAAHGYLPGVSRIASRGWDLIGMHPAKALIKNGQATSNDVAAIPSLHFGTALLIAVFCWPLVGRAMRVVLVAYTITMGFSLVYGGEHYITDELFGALAVAAAFWLCALWERARCRAHCEPVLVPALHQREHSQELMASSRPLREYLDGKLDELTTDSRA